MQKVDEKWDEIKKYLDNFRDQGVMNPLMAGQYIGPRFDLNRQEVRYAMTKWMREA